MMALLQQKLTVFHTSHPHAAIHADLEQGDVTQLPFADASFDVTLMVHVLHLIPNWRDAISEALRVLVPSGVFLTGYDDAARSESHQSVQRQWFKILHELGYDTGRMGPGGFSIASEVFADLESRGLSPEKLRTVSWAVSQTPRAAIEHIANRQWSRTWSIPDEIFQPSIERLWQITTEQFGDQMDVPVSRELQFLLIRARKVA
jgi:SAM-dependent methyltransferase